MAVHVDIEELLEESHADVAMSTTSWTTLCDTGPPLTQHQIKRLLYSISRRSLSEWQFWLRRAQDDRMRKHSMCTIGCVMSFYVRVFVYM